MKEVEHTSSMERTGDTLLEVSQVLGEAMPFGVT